MAFLDLRAELVGHLPGLSPFLAEKYINRAYREILDARNWSFLVADAQVICPPQITAGAVAITQYDADVVLDATASAALLAQTVDGSVPGILQLQIRFSATAPGAGQVYSIVAFDAATDPTAIELTLDKPVVEATNATSGYQCYRAYVIPPITDFKAWIDFVDMPNAITLWRQGTTRTSAEFDRMDPQRASQGLAYYLGSYVGNRISDPVTGATVPNATVDQGTPIYELWPHPTSGQTFYTRFRRKGEELLNPTDEPLVESGLIVQRALGWHAYQWAMANIAHFPTLKGANWPQLINAARSYYREELQDAKRNDDETQLQTVFSRGHGLRDRGRDWLMPIDAAFLQSHYVIW